MKWLVGGTKGGIGKTTVAVNLAANLALNDGSTILVDSDSQAHATIWWRWRRENQLRLPVVELGQAVQTGTESIAPLLNSYARSAKHMVVDAGGRDSTELRAALRVVDVAIFPLLAKQFSVLSIQEVAKVVAVAREYNPQLKCYAFINEASNNTNSQKAAKAQAVIDTFAPHILTLRSVLHVIEAWDDCIPTGQAVFELGMKRKGIRTAVDDFYTLLEELLVALEQGKAA